MGAALIAFTGLLVGAAGLALAIIAVSSLPGSRRRVDELARELHELRRTLPSGPVPPRPAPPPAIAPAPPEPAAPAVGSLARLLATGLATAEAGPAPAVAPPVPAGAEPLRREVVVPAPPAPVPPAAVPPPPAAGVAAPPAAGVAAPPAAGVAAPPATFEERVALVWFTRIGALVLLLGVGFFLKYAADSGWLGPVARLLLGAIAGTAVVVGAELARARTRPIFLHVLTGVGLGILYLVAWASHLLYGLTSAPVAFAGFAAITLAGGALSVRSRAELVLVFSLLGGFLAPVVLSTGADRPLALFAYLVVLTALAFAAAIRLRFVVATWLAVAGTVALVAGWFATRFDPSAGGAYADLGDRWPALFGVGAITAEWLVVARQARRRDLDRITLMALPLAALLFVHAGAALLLHDAPPLLAAVTTALAGLGVVTLLGIRRELVAVPMAACALVLALADRTDGWAAVETLSGSSAALLVYVIALLRGQWSDGRTPGVATLVMVGGATAAFAGLAALVLVIDRPYAFALVLLGLSLGQVALAIAAARPLVALIAALVSLLGLGAVCDHVDGGGVRFVAIAVAWSAIYLGSGAWDLIARRVRPDLLRLASVSVAALGLPQLAWFGLDGPSWAGLVAVDGAALLALGAVLVARQARSAGTILLGQGVGLLALAAAIQFAGPTTIVIWALMAAVVVALAAGAEDGYWLGGGFILFGITVFLLLPRELLVDGSWRTELLHSPRCVALAGLAAALLAAARAASRPRRSWFPIATMLLAGAGHAMVLTLLLTETGNAVTDGDWLLMMTTLGLGLYAVALLVLGFAARSQLHRYFGLGLFALTLGKLALADVWTLRRSYQTVVFLAVGALLVAAGFLYARFGRRLIALLRDGDIGPGRSAG